MPRANDTFYWSISLDVDCPYCDATFDANSEPDFFEQIRGKEVCEEVKNVSVDCPECGKEFTFDIGGGQ